MHTCRICDYHGKMKEYDAMEMLYGTREHFTYEQCPHCDCLQIKYIPEDLGRYYHDDYYSYEKIDGSKKDVDEQEFQVRILDVGCGSGKRISELADMGFHIVHGCDPFIDSDIVYENGVKVYKKTVHEMEGSYDLILLMDSFEHMTDLHGLDIIKEEWNSDNNQIFRSFLYSKGISFYDQQPEVIKFYFSGDELIQMSKASDEAKKRQYGDHALFILALKETEFTEK